MEPNPCSPAASLRAQTTFDHHRADRTVQSSPVRPAHNHAISASVASSCAVAVPCSSSPSPPPSALSPHSAQKPSLPSPTCAVLAVTTSCTPTPPPAHRR
ncbi:hypothetical protein M0R45_036064 [Rubus argutus]|uniref:Uncharacterized protein n=1 Tax=Rubus argutus TaxID=59490 RepID=A0AAW1VYN3_RUBAR